MGKAYKIDSIPVGHKKVRSWAAHNSSNSDSWIIQENLAAGQSVVVVVKNLGVMMTAKIKDFHFVKRRSWLEKILPGDNWHFDEESTSLVADPLLTGETFIGEFTMFGKEPLPWQFQVKLTNLTNKLTALGDSLSAMVEIWTNP